jgi:hypothetical protein
MTDRPAEPDAGGYRLCAMANPRAAALILVAVLVAACTTAAAPSIAGGTTIHGSVTAGPVCPVERPGDSACAPRPVAGAVIVATTPGGKEVARVTSATDGSFALDLPAGDYVLVPQPVTGLMSTAQPLSISVPATGSPTPTPLSVRYDTGIR